jgi:coatomer protein complex subunit alpha (xenin)
LFAIPRDIDPSNPEFVESKRSPGIAAVWVARNKFAILDKTHQVRITLHHIASSVITS